MQKIWTIAKKDFRAYFASPMAYIVIGAFLFIMGWMFYSNMMYFLSYQEQMQYGGQGVSLTDGIIRPLFGNMTIILLFAVPFITMRLFAEERKNHTLELLMTSPITITQMVLGKFLSSLLLVGVMLGVTLAYPLALGILGNPDWGPIFSSYLGIILVAACYISVGVFFSALTDSQIVAGILTFAVLMLFFLINWGAQGAGSTASEVLNYLSLVTHYVNGFSRGLLNSHDIFYYVSFSFVWLFFTHQALDSYRWR